jgi:hypothetical protein
MIKLVAIEVFFFYSEKNKLKKTLFKLNKFIKSISYKRFSKQRNFKNWSEYKEKNLALRLDLNFATLYRKLEN